MKTPKHRKFKVNDLVIVKVDRRRQRGFDAGWGDAMTHLVGSEEICRVVHILEDRPAAVQVRTSKGTAWWFPTKALKFIEKADPE